MGAGGILGRLLRQEVIDGRLFPNREFLFGFPFINA